MSSCEMFVVVSYYLCVVYLFIYLITFLLVVLTYHIQVD